MKKKIFEKWEPLIEIISKKQKGGEKIVFTNGCFDIIHVGHIRYLKRAKKLGDVLIVGINSDNSVRLLKGEGRPITPQEERAEILAGLEFVDYVTFFNELSPYKIIKAFKPDILVKGGDWSVETTIGKDIVEKRGGRVVIIPYVKGVSTSNIINKIKSSFLEE
ncbi:MAG: D-glycero-beta-D-manno-heptose 1-phosphate adenylyltransferase [Deltaproteobacteria bacterium]|nr:D-glycero-beta-D-manno-heptose 1-phosphate adenylyltransferase [Deltaproteobacteria bacterium]